MLKTVRGWFSARRDGPFRFRTIDVVMWWVLVSLVAISFIGEHPIVTIAIAITGGVLIGILSVMSADSLE